MLKVGCNYRITKQVKDKKLSRRICELGFYVGSVICLKHISIFKKSYIFVVKNVAVSLTKNIVEEMGLVYER